MWCRSAVRRRPTGAHFLVSSGLVQFDADWSDAAGRENVLFSAAFQYGADSGELPADMSTGSSHPVSGPVSGIAWDGHQVQSPFQGTAQAWLANDSREFGEKPAAQSTTSDEGWLQRVAAFFHFPPADRYLVPLRWGQECTAETKRGPTIERSRRRHVVFGKVGNDLSCGDGRTISLRHSRFLRWTPVTTTCWPPTIDRLLGIEVAAAAATAPLDQYRRRHWLTLRAGASVAPGRYVHRVRR